ncbi:hypothetical protein [Primorskyibacter sp. S187A]|uniref:hypothetical protein n=1 Tax=Primorskyibacter sp. S187A TaxID=3415130 RepID=UPI003C7E24EF
MGHLEALHSAAKAATFEPDLFNSDLARDADAMEDPEIVTFPSEAQRGQVVSALRTFEANATPVASLTSFCVIKEKWLGW